MPRTGTTGTRLITLRGNSGSGKTTVAGELRRIHGRGLAIIGQDTVRRQILKERDTPGGVTMSMIDLMTRHALDHGFHVVVEGILYADRYGAMLTDLRRDHRGTTRSYYFDLPFAVTVRRHQRRPKAREFGAAEMREWWRPADRLPRGVEESIAEHSDLDATVSRILRDCGLPPS